MYDRRSIDTDRLALRAPTLDDFAAMFEMRRDPDVVRYIGGTTASEEECWARLLRSAGHWALLGYGTWSVRGWRLATATSSDTAPATGARR
jgi:RimJ/RimL family protein N-acetyltransferase